MPEPRLIPCGFCGATNRIPAEKLASGLEPICGRCKHPLVVSGPAISDQPVNVTDATFGAEVERFPLPVVLDLWAPWCQPCRVAAPILDALAVEMAGRVRVAKINIDENPATAARFNVQSIPTLLVFKGGREVDRMIGVQPKSEIARRLNQVIA
jgi:thioredoxin 2